MDDGQEELVERKPRKGTKSCTECRRRKVRCTWSSDDAKICRRCEERGSNCLAQTFFTNASDPRRLTSRQRIQHLEAKVANLGRAVRGLEAKLGSQQLETPESATTLHQPESLPDDDDDMSSSSDYSDILAMEKPTHLRSLFQNDWISAEAQTRYPKSLEHKNKNATRLLDIARQALQKFIPAREVLEGILSHAYAAKWLEHMQVLFPHPYIIKTSHDFLATYDEIHEPDVDAIRLASWLLALSLTAVQLPHDPDSPGSKYNGTMAGLNFANTVADTIETTILSQTGLINSIDGLGLAMLSARLHIFQGSYQKGWLSVRRSVAIAELMGLPQIQQLVDTHGIAESLSSDDPKVLKADLWDSILSLDRLCSTMLNLPSGTRIYAHLTTRQIVLNGQVQARIYLSRLADIAIKAQYVDDINAASANKPDLYNTVLQLDKEIRTLTAKVPISWWQEPVPGGLVEPYQVVQQWHYYVAMRVHLPFILLSDSGPLYMYSRLSGLDACRSIIRRYLILRRSSPAAFFLGRFLDLQAFLATIVLILSSSMPNVSSTPSDLSVVGNNDDIDGIIANVVSLMEEKSKGILGPANFGRHGVITIRALSKLLRGNNADGSDPESLTLKVPLLGKLHVRRTRGTMHGNFSSQSAMQQFQTGGLDVPQYPAAGIPPVAQSPQTQSALMSGAVLGPGGAPMQPMGLPLDPLSWSVDNSYEDFFQDAMMEGFENWDAGMI